ncbi:MAG: glycine cleavage system aminomethyltransferase GcvT [Gammaproteobacteria bacterium]|nr:glycine cleavage system aminomethyltransferase GcvT [Gammaproteobacteria bacterium]NND53404.1 glycine cleavage system aminomethyltransferase GcvT [Gammaproteobacteria bacterium]
MQQTTLYGRHVAAGAKMVDFGGWAMPLHYGSQIEEHHVVRRAAGMFDVSHMTVVDIDGSDSAVWLRTLLANDIGRLVQPGKGLYSCMLNEQGGVVDDLIAYSCGGNRYRLIVNAATRDQDLAWMRATAAGRDVVINERSDLAMIAVQGPDARAIAAPLLPNALGDAAMELGKFEALQAGEIFVARTGYTGEDGWEIVLPPAAAATLWDALAEAGVAPCGLGARDTLRLEAGLNLYGQDMDTVTTPLVSNLAWTVAWEPAERDFIGRAALESERGAGPQHQLVGLLLEGRGVMRAGQVVRTSAGDGEITSGGFSPTMERSIAFARVPTGVAADCEVQIRKNEVPARIVKAPFVRNGEIIVT